MSKRLKHINKDVEDLEKANWDLDNKVFKLSRQLATLFDYLELASIKTDNAIFTSYQVVKKSDIHTVSGK